MTQLRTSGSQRLTTSGAGGAADPLVPDRHPGRRVVDHHPQHREQVERLNLLVGALREIGAQDATLTEYGAVLATIPATVAADTPIT